MPSWSRRSAALAIALFLVACGDDDSFNPTVEQVSGSYSASSFTLTSSSGIVDLLSSGASVQVTLTSHGATAGRLLLPGTGTEGDHDEDLTAARDELTGTRLLGGETLRWVLTRNR
ncbi:MAG TPA: hypothetical protein VFI41_00680 [Gemmatimonadales bacterium]|nr:hypothetical protein [Gemmatimonadales bacterium]